MIFKTKVPDLDKFEDVVIGQEEELEPEIAQLRGYIDKKRRNAALTEVATKVSRRGTSCLAVRTSLQSAKSGLAFRTHSNANVTGLFSRQRLAREGSTEWRKRDSLGSRILTAC